MTENSYDRVVYPSYPYHPSHPDQTAAVARLFGLAAPPAAGSRVLELGAAGGGNLLPLAEQFPDAQFVGVDLSGRQVEAGRAVARAVGLTNVRLEHADLSDIGPGWGAFDYVICHGVYSWVADDVRDRILAVCRDRLTPNGVGYVSYNTYPGWHMRGMLREIMCFHAARYARPEEQVREARGLLDFLAEAAGEAATPYALLLKQETQLLRGQSDAYLFHEHLEEHNVPCYFFEFVQAARRNGLDYLGDAAFSTMLPTGLPAKVQHTLHRLAYDLIQMEQYLDFVRNRTFRASLVCRAGVRLDRKVDPGVLEGLYFAADAARVAAAGGVAGDTFALRGRGTVTVAPGPAAAVLDAVGAAWPANVGFADVAAALAAAGLVPAGPAGWGPTARTLLDLLAAGAVTASAGPVRCATAVSAAPTASRLARHLAADGWVPTRRHDVLRLDDLGRRVVPLLDGSRSPAVVADAVATALIADRVPVRAADGEVVRDPLAARQHIGRGVHDCLAALARAGVLIG